jgi:hypothetical protein
MPMSKSKSLHCPWPWQTLLGTQAQPKVHPVGRSTQVGAGE